MDRASFESADLHAALQPPSLQRRPPSRARLSPAAALLAVEQQVARADDVDDAPIRSAAETAMLAGLRADTYCLSTIERSAWAVGQAAAAGALYNRRAANRPGALAAVIAGIHAALFQATDAKRQELRRMLQQTDSRGTLPEHDLSSHPDSLIAAMSRAAGERATQTIVELAQQGPVDLEPAWAAALDGFQASQIATRGLSHRSQRIERRPAGTRRARQTR
jgi:hypothetical protein